jgi:lactate dehydrogenase-like 2-hydroxyacid dehydrogenase
VDLEATSVRGIPVGHGPGILAETNADLVFGLMRAAARYLSEVAQAAADARKRS